VTLRFAWRVEEKIKVLNRNSRRNELEEEKRGCGGGRAAEIRARGKGGFPRTQRGEESLSRDRRAERGLQDREIASETKRFQSDRPD